MTGDWEQALGEYLQRLQVRGYAQATRCKLSQRVHSLQAFVGLDLAALQSEHLRAFLAHQQGLMLDRSASEKVARLRPFLRWAVQRGFLLLDPCQQLELPSICRPSLVALSQAQVQRLLRASDPSTVLGLRDQAVLETLYGTGLRHLECCGLNLTDYDPQERVLRVRQGKMRERLALVGDHLAQVLTDYLERSRGPLARPETIALFVSRGGLPLGYDGLARVVRRTGKRVGLKGLTPHALRRAFATHLLRNGAELGAVKALLGHRCWKATEFYTQLLPLDLVEEYRRTHPRAVLESRA